MAYDLRLKEEELKNKVARDYFKGFDTTRIIEQIDFCISKELPKSKIKSKTKSKDSFIDDSENVFYYLWAEAKKGSKSDIYESFVQLILTIGKKRIYDKHLPPAFLGAFDAKRIAFLPYYKIMDIFSQSDFNWNVTPSNHNTKEFKQLLKLVKDILQSESFSYKFGADDEEIKDFIKNNFVVKDDKDEISKVQIDKNNFVNIYYKWLKAVKDSISVDWERAKKNGIIDADFYLADLLSKNNLTLKEKLFVILKKDHYELERTIDDMGLVSSKSTHFYDKQKAHNQFWKRYKRPPKEEYWDYIIARRDLLVPQDIRERKGSFFTPQIWVEKSQNYIAEVLGENWQDEYYIWDLAAGTGNLLAGLTNKYNIWASTIDQADVDIMHERIKNGANLLESHVFKFDFLNDDFSKLPEELQSIIKDKPNKLVIYINPPYAEATSATTRTGTGKNKSLVARGNKISEDYKDILGKANNEIFAQFFIRIYKEIPNCIFSSFSTLKYVNSTNFMQFREYFKAKFKNGFICPAWTFDNVKGKFPIGFLIWDTSVKETIKNISIDIYDIYAAPCYPFKKNFYSNIDKNINKWIKEYDNKNAIQIAGYMENPTPDFQNNSFLCIINKHGTRHNNYFAFNPNNFFIGCIYFYVRHCIPHTWINNNDQFLYPMPKVGISHNKYEEDAEFQCDCLAFTLFHGHNRITSTEGVNHWIPFSEKEVGAKDSFKSHFMYDFINGKIKPSKESEDDFLEKSDFIPKKPIIFSKEAKEVFEAGKELWRYYHSHSYTEANASFYDIRKYFQKTDEKGRMNNKSTDEEYNKLIGDLRLKMKYLAKKIEPKIYKYGFLKK